MTAIGHIGRKCDSHRPCLALIHSLRGSLEFLTKYIYFELPPAAEPPLNEISFSSNSQQIPSPTCRSSCKLPPLTSTPWDPQPPSHIHRAKFLNSGAGTYPQTTCPYTNNTGIIITAMPHLPASLHRSAGSLISLWFHLQTGPPHPSPSFLPQILLTINSSSLHTFHTHILHVPLRNGTIDPSIPPHLFPSFPTSTTSSTGCYPHHQPLPPAFRNPFTTPHSPHLHFTLLATAIHIDSMNTARHSNPHTLPSRYPFTFAIVKLANMSSAIPDISIASPALYRAQRPDPRHPHGCILPPPFSDIPEQYTPRDLQGCFLLPVPTADRPSLKMKETVQISIRFYAQGTKICNTKATVRYVQYIPTYRVGSKSGDAWSIFSGATEHESSSKSTFLVALSTSFPDFPVDVLWVEITKFPGCGTTMLIHPFTTVLGGDAIQLYSIQFPVGISPYALLHYGGALIPNITNALQTLCPSAAHTISSFTKHLFPFITPAIHHHMGGTRLAILSAEEIPPSLIDHIYEVPSLLPDWSGSPFVEGLIPIDDTVIDVGGHLPAASIMDSPDYQPGTLATYFHLPNSTLLSTTLTHLNTHLRDIISFTDEEPTWSTHQEFQTPFGAVHLVIHPLNSTASPPGTRSTILNLQVSDAVNITCVHVYLRVDIAYYTHLPIVVVGGFVKHLPLKGCSSPSSLLLSSHQGSPPLEAYYLLNVYDCASAYAQRFLAPPPPNPIVNPTPLPTSSTLPQPPLPPSPDDTPIHKGRPPASRSTPGPYGTRPTTQTPHSKSKTIWPNRERHPGWGPTPFPTSYPSTDIPSSSFPSNPPSSPHDSALDDHKAYVNARLISLEGRIATLETQILNSQPPIPAESAQTPVFSAFEDIGNNTTTTPIHQYSLSQTLAPRPQLLAQSANPERHPPAPVKHHLPILPWTWTNQPNASQQNLSLLDSSHSTSCSHLSSNSNLHPKYLCSPLHYPSTSPIPAKHIFSSYTPKIPTIITSPQHIFLHLGHCTFTFHGPFPPTSTLQSIMLASIPNILFPHVSPSITPLPSTLPPYRLTFNGNPLPLSTPVHKLNHEFIDLHIIFPILGSSPQHSTIPHSTPSPHTITTHHTSPPPTL